MLFKKSIKKWVVGLVILVGVVAGLAGQFRESSEQKEQNKTGKSVVATQKAIIVSAEKCRKIPVQKSIAIVGTMIGKEEVFISPKVEGRVIKIYHDIGDELKPGEPLLDIDPTDFQLAIAEAKRALELELAKLGLKEIPQENFDITTTPMVIKAAAMERYMQARRNRAVRASVSTSVEEKDLAQADFDVAHANYVQAVLDAKAILAGAKHKKAMLETAMQHLADTRMVVPKINYQGDSQNQISSFFVMTQKSVSCGEMVRIMPGSSNTLFKLVLDNELKLSAMVPERYKSEVQIGQRVEMEVAAYPGKKIIGEIARINPAIDRATRSFMVEIHVDNRERLLSAGSFARGKIQIDKMQKSIVVPEEAIVRFAGVSKIFIIKKDRASEILVQTGITISMSEGKKKRSFIQVFGDVPEEGLVITSGQTQLAEGVFVKLRQTDFSNDPTK